MSNRTPDHPTSFELSIRYVAAATVGVIVGAGAVGAAVISKEYERGDGIPDELDNTTACNSDPFSFVSADETYVVADSRCRQAQLGKINVYEETEETSESASGPIASVKLGTMLAARCIAVGHPAELEGISKNTADTWVLVDLKASGAEGVQYMTDKTVGFVSTYDVIGERSLPSCENSLQTA